MIKLKKEIINFKILFIFISIMVILPPKLIEYVNWMSKFKNVLLIIIFSILVFIYLISIALKINKGVSKLLFYIILAEIGLLISTIINGVSFIYRFKLNMGFLSLILIFELNKYLEFKNIIKSLYYYFTTIVLINLITCILLPNGIVADTTFSAESEAIHILGKANEFLPVFIVTSIIMFIYSKITQSYKYSNFILLCITINVFIVDSATGRYLWLLFLSILLLINLPLIRNKAYKMINFKILLITIFFAFIFGVVLNSKGMFEDLFIYMGRDITLTGRTTIWNSALELFSKQPIYGHGVYQGHGLITVSWQSWIKGSDTFITCHNTYLDFMLQGGLIYMFLTIYTLFLCDKRAKECNNHKLTMKIRILIFIYMIGMLVEGIGNNGYFYTAICLFYYLPNIYWDIKE